MPTFGVTYDKQQIEAAIDRVIQELPGQIERIRYSVGEDWASEPALFFRVLLTDPGDRFVNLLLSDIETKRDFTGLCHSIVRSLSNELRSEMYQPYFEFRTVAEQESLRSPEWDSHTTC